MGNLDERTEPSQSAETSAGGNPKPPHWRSRRARLSRWLGVGAGLLLGLGSNLLQGQIPIERAQRAFQARFEYLTGQRVQWPDCRCGPAPAYPKDGFYGRLEEDPDLGVRLVKDLATNFLTAQLHPNFVKWTNEVDAAAELAHFSEEDFPGISPDDVNPGNFAQQAQSIEAALQSLQWLWVPTGITGTNPASTNDRSFGCTDRRIPAASAARTRGSAKRSVRAHASCASTRPISSIGGASRIRS